MFLPWILLSLLCMYLHKTTCVTWKRGWFCKWCSYEKSKKSRRTYRINISSSIFFQIFSLPLNPTTFSSTFAITSLTAIQTNDINEDTTFFLFLLSNEMDIPRYHYIGMHAHIYQTYSLVYCLYFTPELQFIKKLWKSPVSDIGIKKRPVKSPTR